MRTGPSRCRWFLSVFFFVATVLGGERARAADPPPGGTLVLQPQAASENCSAAQDALQALVATLESEILPAQLAEARQHLAAEAAVAQAWSDFAAAVLLMGDLKLAAWAGLQAVTREWNAELVGNAGTFLLNAGREEARTWLLCAQAMGPRSVYVLEALAVAQEKAGDLGAAREAIGKARRLDPDDPMIEIEHAFLTTGAPPPPASRPDEAGERCYLDLKQHAERVFAQVGAQHERLDRLTGPVGSRVQAFSGSWETIYEPLLASMRGLLDAPAQPGPQAMWHNQILVQCITYYFSFTDILLTSVVRDSGTTLTFWAEVMRLDPALFVRNITDPEVTDPFVYSTDRLPSTRVDKALVDADDEAARQYRRDKDACNAIRDGAAASACSERALARECASNVANFENWAARQSVNYNAAAQGFDRVALEFLRWVEGEVGQARSFAARYAEEFEAGGAAYPGPEGQPMTAAEMALYQINLSYQTLLLEPYLTTGPNGVDDFNAEQALWFDREKQWFEEDVESRRQSLEDRCVPILFRAELEALAQEQWEAYRQELWDRMTANIEGEWDAQIECEGTIGGVTVSINDDGFDSLSVKWKKVGAALDKTGKVKLSGSYKYKNVTVSAQTTIADGQVVSTALEASGPVAPGVTATGGISVVSDGRRDEPGIVFSGSLGVGFERELGGGLGSAGISCTPGRGSLKVYPRALTESAVTYVLAGGAG